jgi:hypothetical protein
MLMQHKTVGRVETGEKPELLWEHPELERLYMRLADEYELRDRDRALDRKLDIVARTVETLLGLVQTRSSLRVEWYIVLLIVAELLLTTYPLILPPTRKASLSRATVPACSAKAAVPRLTLALSAPEGGKGTSPRRCPSGL